MRIGFDATGLAARGKGIARFQAECLAALGRLDRPLELTVFVPEGIEPPALEPGWSSVAVRARPMLRWEQIELPRRARAERLDVVITTSERAALWGPPQVVYVYEHPKHRARRARQARAGLRQRLVDATTRVLFQVAMRRAARVLAASHATAADLAWAPRVSVVYSGVSAEFSPDEARGAARREALELAGGYFLHIASDDPRDNSETVLEALALLAREAVRPALVVAGPVLVRRAPLERLAQERDVAQQIRWVGFRSGRDLVDLYRGATAYVDPSLYEGFGLQVAEALACGTPAVTSNRMSLPEVVGDAGLLYDPDDAAGFADAMRRLLDDDGLRERLSERAVAQATRFTWDRTAAEVVAACDEIVRTRRG